MLVCFDSEGKLMVKPKMEGWEKKGGDYIFRHETRLVGSALICRILCTQEVRKEEWRLQ